MLLVGFVVLVVGVSWSVSALFGRGAGVLGVVVGLVVAGATSAVAYWKSDAIALRMSRAVPADEVTYARLHNLVEGLCIAAGLPKPRVYVVDDPAPNAFATGRNPQHAAIAVTTGLLDKLNRVELEGVLAHELSHIKNYDILVTTLAVTLVGVVSLMADFAIRALWWGGGSRRSGGSDHGGGGAAGLVAVFGFVLLLIAPLLGRIMQAAVSRRRESLADVSAASLTRYPPGLISALEKLQGDRTVVRTASRATAHLWIEEPVAAHASPQRQRRLDHLFNTHPPIEERIAALREL